MEMRATSTRFQMFPKYEDTFPAKLLDVWLIIWAATKKEYFFLKFNLKFKFCTVPHLSDFRDENDDEPQIETHLWDGVVEPEAEEGHVGVHLSLIHI